MSTANENLITGNCGFDGDIDLYGLGIRIGFYLQYFSFLVASFSVGSKKPSDDSARTSAVLNVLRLSLFVYALSMFVVVVRETARHAVFAVEVGHLMYITLPFVMITIHDERWRAENPLGFRAMAALNTGMLCFFVWYYFRGLEELPRTGCTEDYAFFFAKVNLYGWFRTFQKVVWTPFAICYGIWTLYFMIRWNNTSSDGGGYMFSDMAVVGIWISTPVIVLATELSIKWNLIRGVYNADTPGQLVPLILGVGMFVYLANSMFEDNKKAKEEAKERNRDMP